MKIGPLDIGTPARIVGTATCEETVAACAEGRLQPACDILELRLDLLGGYDAWSRVRPYLARLNRPVLLTVRRSDEGGAWEGGARERVSLFEHAMPYVGAVDIEYRAGERDDVLALAASAQKGAVVSYHDFKGTPEPGTLVEVVRDIARLGDVVAKVVTTPRAASDVEVLRQLLAGTGHGLLCVMGMGERGRATRVEFPRLGSCLAYGYLDGAAAPGQPSVEELSAALRPPSQA